MAVEDQGPAGVTEPRARMLRWGAAIVVLLGATVAVTVWRALPVESAVGWMLAVVVVFSVACGGLMVRRAAQWRRFAAVPSEREPALVEVVAVVLTRSGFGVDHRPIRGVRFPGSFGIPRWFDLTPPEPGEELEVWSLHPGGGGPLLVRQSDGTWWAASGSLH